MTIGPDAARYLHLANDVKVARPFHLRWLLPKLCGTELAAWRAVRLGSWPVLAGAAFWWAHNNGFGWQAAITIAILLLALPGITGPDAVNPVGVDLPATALGLVAAALFDAGHPAATVAAFVWGTVRKCSAPAQGWWPTPSAKRESAISETRRC